MTTRPATPTRQLPVRHLPTRKHQPAPRRRRTPKHRKDGGARGRPRPDGTEAPAEEAECGNAPSDVVDGDLEGFAGTTPFGEITPEFIARLCEVDPNLQDLNYATETYDAIMITALAVLAGRRPTASRTPRRINGITRDGEMCTTFADCAALIEAGTDIDYDGISGPLTFAGNGEPIVASYGLLKMGNNNRIDISQTEYITAEGPPEARRPAGTRRGLTARATAC